MFLFIYFFGWADLHCRVGAFCSCGDGGSSLLVVLGLLTAVASLAAGHVIFRSSGSRARYLWCPEIRCSMASWIFLDQGSNACSSAFPGGYFSTEPPGKPSSFFLNGIFIFKGSHNSLWIYSLLFLHNDRSCRIRN